MPRPNATTTRPSTAPTGTASRPSFQPLPHALYSASGSSRIHPALAKGMSYMNPRMITADDKAAALEKLKPRAKMKSAKEEANAMLKPWLHSMTTVNQEFEDLEDSEDDLNNRIRTVSQDEEELEAETGPQLAPDDAYVGGAGGGGG